MPDIRQPFPSLEGPSGQGFALKMVREGDSPFNQNASIGFTYKDYNDNVVLPKLTEDQRLRVDNFFGTTPERDIAGRLRVGSPQTIFDATFRYNKLPTLFVESLTGSSTSTQNALTSSVNMTVTTASGDNVIRQTRRKFKYNPGKSQQILMTGNFGIARANVRKRLGLFDENNGVFFEQNGTTNRVVLRSNTSGSPVNTTIDQSDWNIDKFDGMGPSGVSVDFSKQHLFCIDFLWLGSGVLRFGLYLNDRFYFCHKIINTNVISTPFMQTATLPVRYEIENLNTSAGSTTLTQTCVSVNSEGGYSPVGFIRSVDNGITSRVVSNTDYLPLISIRIKSGFLNATVKLLKAVIFAETLDDINFQIMLNPTLTGASFVSGSDIIEYDVSATSFTGGTKIDSGYVRGAQFSPSTFDTSIFLSEDLFVSTDISGTSDILTLACRSTQNDSNCFGSLTYSELY